MPQNAINSAESLYNLVRSVFNKPDEFQIQEVIKAWQKFLQSKTSLNDWVSLPEAKRENFRSLLSSFANLMQFLPPTLQGNKSVFTDLKRATEDLAVGYDGYKKSLCWIYIENALRNSSDYHEGSYKTADSCKTWLEKARKMDSEYFFHVISGILFDGTIFCPWANNQMREKLYAFNREGGINDPIIFISAAKFYFTISKNDEKAFEMLDDAVRFIGVNLSVHKSEFLELVDKVKDP